VPAELARRLNRFDAAMIVVSGIIGSGIFINPYVVAARVETPFLILAVWFAGGVIALAGAFVFAELATVVPRAGGQYAYFREAFGPIFGFLHGWSLLFIIQTGATAAVAMTFGEYLARLFGLGAGSVPVLAVALLLGLSCFHALGIKPGAILVNVITVAKLLALAILIIGALAFGGPTKITLTPLAPANLGTFGLISAFFAGLVPTMFAYGGWQNSAFVVEEIRGAERTLPRAILLGVAIVIAVYLGANLAYVHVLGAPALAGTRAPAADLAQAIVGDIGAKTVGILVVVSTFGFLNLALMTAPRVYYAMARDGLFFAAAARVTPRTHAPAVAILTQGALAAVYALANTYDRLLGFAVFADWIFFALAGVALVVFRRTKPDAPRPYPTPLYPWVPLLFIVAGAGIVLNLFVADPKNALVGSAILAAGVVTYFISRRVRASV